jgi:hypothetical protein
MHLAAAARRAHGAQLSPDLLRGVSTYWWEFLRAVPQLDVVYVPIGQGSGVCSAIAAKLALGHGVRVVGVVSSHATTYADSLAAGRVVEAPVTTQLADGMACRVADARRWPCCTAHRPHRAGQRRRGGRRHARLFTDTHNVAEGAGAAALAAALQERDRPAGQVVGTTLCGGNVDADVFSQVLCSHRGLAYRAASTAWFASLSIACVARETKAGWLVHLNAAMGTLYLVRHGQASFGADDYDQLSARGRRRACGWANTWRAQGQAFDAVLTGTLRRHAQTLKAFAEGLQITPEAAADGPGLNEYDSLA